MKQLIILSLIVGMTAQMSVAQTLRKKLYQLKEGESVYNDKIDSPNMADAEGNFVLFLVRTVNKENELVVQSTKERLEGLALSNTFLKVIRNEANQAMATVIERTSPNKEAILTLKEGLILRDNTISTFEVTPSGEAFLKVDKQVNKQDEVLKTTIFMDKAKPTEITGDAIIYMNENGWAASSVANENQITKQVFFSNGKEFYDLPKFQMMANLPNNGLLLAYQNEKGLELLINETRYTYVMQENEYVEIVTEAGASNNCAFVIARQEADKTLFQVNTFKGYKSPIYEDVLPSSIIYDLQSDRYYWLATKHYDSDSLLLCNDKGEEKVVPLSVNDAEKYKAKRFTNKDWYISYVLMGNTKGERYEVIRSDKGKVKVVTYEGISEVVPTLKGDILIKSIYDNNNISHQYEVPNHDKVTSPYLLSDIKINDSGKNWWGFDKNNGFYLINDDLETPLGSVLYFGYDAKKNYLYWLTLEEGGKVVYWNGKQLE